MNQATLMKGFEHFIQQTLNVTINAKNLITIINTPGFTPFGLTDEDYSIYSMWECWEAASKFTEKYNTMIPSNITLSGDTGDDYDRAMKGI